MIPSLNTSILYLAAFTVLWKETSCCIYLTHTVSHWKNITDVLVCHAGIFKFAQSQTGLGWTLNIIYFQIYHFFSNVCGAMLNPKNVSKRNKDHNSFPQYFFFHFIVLQKERAGEFPILKHNMLLCVCVVVFYYYVISMQHN